jgi:PBP1b-binding outer membrane lipoprotein LpoB
MMKRIAALCCLALLILLLPGCKGAVKAGAVNNTNEQQSETGN